MIASVLYFATVLFVWVKHRDVLLIGVVVKTDALCKIDRVIKWLRKRVDYEYEALVVFQL